jgi:hypothetical protein
VKLSFWKFSSISLVKLDTFQIKRLLKMACVPSGSRLQSKGKYSVLRSRRGRPRTQAVPEAATQRVPECSMALLSLPTTKSVLPCYSGGIQVKFSSAGAHSWALELCRRYFGA